MELKARQSGIDSDKDERQFSPALMAGLLINSCALLMGQSDSLSATMTGPVRMVLQIFAIVLMLVGIAQTAAKCRK